MLTSESELFPSPLRYPGGKGKIANFLKLLFLENSYVGYDYVEPFAGGASVALSLLFEQYADRIRINDLDVAIYSFWRSVLEDPDELCELIERTPVNMDVWHEQKEVYTEGVKGESVGIDLAFATFFLNRTNRSGIIEGGPIGGHTQTGKWKLDARFNRQDLCRRIRKIGRYRSRIAVTRTDAESFLDSLVDCDGDRFVYLDPPYFGKGAELYANWYSADDHASLAQRVARLEGPWLVSYDRVPEVCDLYADQRSLDYELAYSAQERYRGSEVMFVSRGVRLPDVAGPVNIPASAVGDARLMQLSS